MTSHGVLCLNVGKEGSVGRLLEHNEFSDFIAYLRLKNLSARTITEYGKVLHALFSHVGLDGSSPKEITSAQLRDYVASLQQRGLAAKTVSNHVLIIKRFFGFLSEEGYIAEDPSRRLPRPKVGKRLPRALTITQVQDLFAAFEAETRLQRRDKMFFQLLYACGLRLSEASNIRVEDIDLGEGTIRVVGKGDKERRLYLKPNLLQSLGEYIAENELRTYLFPGRGPDKPVTGRNMGDRFREYARVAGLGDRVTPHTLRHSIAVHYLINGAPITFVQGLLGHASLATTGIYTQLADEMTKEIALNTPTALDDILPRGKESLKERGLAYHSALEEADKLVEELLREV